MIHLTAKEQKHKGAHYTPKALADFVATQICSHTDFIAEKGSAIRILDPAVGDGELLKSLLICIRERTDATIEACGFDTDATALGMAEICVDELNIGGVTTNWMPRDFLDFVFAEYLDRLGPLFSRDDNENQFDLVIANPPYVRTQVLGQAKAREVASRFKIKGRVDLYQAFLLAIAEVLKPSGVAGVIVSNRFLTTQAGASVRRGLLDRYDLRHVWDLGDTRLFEAAVLPAVLVMQKPAGRRITKGKVTRFTTIYSANENGNENKSNVGSIFDGIEHDGTICTPNGDYMLRQGVLDSGDAPGDVWRVSNSSTENWLKKIDARTALRFSDVGKVRVGVKTTADKVFIREDWDSFPDNSKPELLRPLITHHEARRFRAAPLNAKREILYTHCMKDGKRVSVDLSEYPKARAYLEEYRERLEGRKYVREAGRDWFEIWVPHCPQEWDRPKVVFRDISEHPVFWIDLSGSVVNGDCYWITASSAEKESLLWLLLGVANSVFIEEYYDNSIR